MTARSYRLYVEDILDAIVKIERYTRGMTFDEWAERDQSIDAVMRNLQIIGEAARKHTG